MNKGKKKSNDLPSSIWTLDTETRGLFGEIFRIGIYNGTKYWKFSDMTEAYDFLKASAKKEEIHLYIHNLDFDLSKMAGTIAKDIEFNRCIFIDRNVAVFGTTTNIILHDSLKIIPGTLEKICKDFGLGKASKIDLSDYLKENNYAVYDEEGKYDKDGSLENYFMNVDPDEEMLNTYLEFDCTSLHAVVMELLKVSGLTQEEFLKCPTSASLAMKVFKENYPDDYADACSSNYHGEFGRFVEDILRQAYYGGRTEVFLPYLDGGFHYDVSSEYPWAMKTFEYPIGYYDVYQEDKAWDVYDEWKETGKGGGFAWVKIYVPEDMHIPPLPYRAKHKKRAKRSGLEGKLIFPVGHLDGVWAFPEIAMAEKVGCTIEKVEEVIFYKKTYPIFREFIEYWEKVKVEATISHQLSLRTFSKLVQNALYGKFGMRRKRSSIKDISELEKIKESGKMFIEFENDDLGLEMVQVEEEVNSDYIQVHIAAYVTAYARIHLYEGLTFPTNGEVAYCDTDSVACENEFPAEMIDESEYGKWKLENVIKYGIFLQPKLYFEKSDIEKAEKDFPELVEELKKNPLTIKAKGIPSKIKKKFTEETYQTIYNQIKEGKEKIHFFGTEDSLFDKEYYRRGKFVSLFLNGMNFDEKIKIQKGMNLRAKQKRQMNYIENYSKPWVIHDYGKEWEHQQQIQMKLEIEKEYAAIDPIEDKIKEIGFILIPKKGEQYFEEYSNLGISTKRKYFRKKGLSIDVWATEAGYDTSELMDSVLD
jgi:hypothetical protein